MVSRSRTVPDVSGYPIWLSTVSPARPVIRAGTNAGVRNPSRAGRPRAGTVLTVLTAPVELATAAGYGWALMMDAISPAAAG